MSKNDYQVNKDFVRRVKFKEVSKSEWPQSNPLPTKVYLNSDFLVQVFDETETTRLSVNRTKRNAKGDWKDSISWDELMTIKNSIGYGGKWAVEIYPPNSDIVNVANIRHLWICDQLPFAWSRGA